MIHFESDEPNLEIPLRYSMGKIPRAVIGVLH